MPAPRVSIVVVNYNGRRHLQTCLESLASLRYPGDDYEVVLVDNGSTDGSPEMVAKLFPAVRVVALAQNTGFAEGNNRGAREALGRILVFLNSDTRVEPTWLAELVAPLGNALSHEADRSMRIAATASRLLDWTGSGVDFPGYPTWLGMPYASKDDRQHRRPEDYEVPQYLLFASGAAMAIRREVFEDVGGFDTDYFMYHEDVDLGWRLWLKGYAVLYVPGATAYHHSGGSTRGDPSPLYFLNERNALYTVIKNAGDAWLSKLLPLLLLWLIERTGQYLTVRPAAYASGRTEGLRSSPLRAPRGSLAGVAAGMDLIRAMPRLLEKRAVVQAERRRSDEEIAALFDLPREVFVQIMLKGGLDPDPAMRLIDTFGLSLGETSLFGRYATRLGRLGSPEFAPGPLMDCLLYLADHGTDDAQVRFGDDVVTRLAGVVGISRRDLPVLARVLTLLGSRLLAGLVAPGASRPGGTRDSVDGEPRRELQEFVRDALWRDAVFYREELLKRLSAASEARTAARTQPARITWRPMRRVYGAALGLTHEASAWMRAALPQRTKDWIKRVILGRPSAWGAPGPSPRVSSMSPSEISTARAPLAGVPASLGPSAYDVIMLPVIDWHFRFQRSQQLACQFADHGHRVFYISVTFGDGGGEAGPTHEVTTVRPGVYEVRLLGRRRPNVYRDRLEEPVLRDFARAFDELREHFSLVDVVCIAQLPFWRPLGAHLRASRGWRLIYDCVDRHGDFSTNAPIMVDEEALLVHESDLVVATSRLLYQEQRARNPHCIRVPNAADYAHFSVLVGEGPRWLQSLQRPVVGYYGAIAEWFDTELVAAVARLRPQWSVVLVGSTFTADLRPIGRLPNVHLPGEQPYAQLPAFLHAFDVCIIPFKRIPLTEAADPVKFYEYISAGKPVVSVPLPDLEAPAAEGLVAFAEDAASFVRCIETALAEDSSPAAARRRYAERHTWVERYRQFAQAIRDLHPMASIVIPTHDNLHFTRLCIDAIERNTSWPNYEIVVVDNASTDGTVDYLRALQARVPRLRAIFNDRNEGFAGAVNKGLTAAAGEYLVLLNNDTLVTRGWLSTMIWYLETHADVGMIGPATNQAGNEARIPVDYHNLADMETFAAQYTREHADRRVDLDMLGFFCAVIPRRVLNKVGLLDERFGLGMFEDDDFSLRARRAGLRLVCTDAAFVHHFHSATMRRLSPDEYRRLFEENRAKFEQKWGVRWTPHRYRWQR